MLPYRVFELRYYHYGQWAKPVRKLVYGPRAAAAAKVTVALGAARAGQHLERKAVGEGVARIPDRLGAGLQGLFRPRWRDAGDPADGRHEEAPAARHRPREGVCGRTTSGGGRRRYDETEASDGIDARFQGTGAEAGRERSRLRRSAAARRHRHHARRRCRYRQGDPARLHQGDGRLREAGRGDRHASQRASSACSARAAIRRRAICSASSAICKSKRAWNCTSQRVQPDRRLDTLASVPKPHHVRSKVPGQALGCGPSSGSGMNSWLSSGGSDIRPAFQSAFACSIRSCRDDTRFHQMKRGPMLRRRAASRAPARPRRRSRARRRRRTPASGRPDAARHRAPPCRDTT